MSAFRLEPYEELIGGVRNREGVLTLRPTRGAMAAALWGVVVGTLFFVAAGVLMGSIAFAVIGGAAALVPTAPFLRCRVRAEGTQVLVVNKWGRHRFLAAEVAGVDVREVRGGLGLMPLRGPLTIWPRRLAVCHLVPANGVPIRCDALTGLVGDSLGSPTPIETKAAILARWIAAAKD